MEQHIAQATDDELYSCYLAGDMEAGDALMVRYADQLTAYLYSFLKDRSDAEDLMLDCFAVILVDKPKIGKGTFRAYLFTVARHKACSLWNRKQKRKEFSLQEDVDAEDSQPGVPETKAVNPEELTLKAERNAILHKCLNRIAPQYREALWLTYSMEFDYGQTADIMACNTKKVDNLLMNGKKALRKELEKEGITYVDI